jgi:hypothetical protein
MIRPLILVGFVLAGAWASVLCAVDDELERDQGHKRIDPRAGQKQDKRIQPAETITQEVHPL